MPCYRNMSFGRIGIQERDGYITHLYLPGRGTETSEIETPLVRCAFEQLEAYFSGCLKRFELPLHAEGTTFQRQVWEALCRVPYGHIASYKAIAVAIGNPNACRAVGMANNRNPLAIFIPCHRIVGSNGALVGYGGGLSLKQRLLALERETLAEHHESNVI